MFNGLLKYHVPKQRPISQEFCYCNRKQSLVYSIVEISLFTQNLFTWFSIKAIKLFLM